MIGMLLVPLTGDITGLNYPSIGGGDPPAKIMFSYGLLRSSLP
jgi:hypothetical protein